MDRIFIDSSIFVSHCMVADETFIHLLEKDGEIYTSPGVLEESLYKSLLLRCEEVYKRPDKHLLKARFEKEGENFEPVLHYFNDFLKRLSDIGTLTVVPVNASIFFLSLECSRKFRLLPNDALIAATCKHHGIDRIATFDSDFERVDFLEIIKTRS